MKQLPSSSLLLALAICGPAYFAPSRALAQAPAAAVSPAIGAPAAAERLFASFEKEEEIQDGRLNHATATLVETGVSHGKKALGLTFNPPASYPGYSFPIAQAQDWTGFGGIAFEVTNTGTESTPFALRIDTALKSDGSNNSRTRAGRVEPGKTVTFLMPFDAEVESPDMSKLPGYTLMRDSNARWSPFNLRNIVAMQIFSVKPTAPRSLVFDNFRLVPALPAPPPVPLKTETRPLLSFETDTEAITIKDSSASHKADSRGATDGKRGLYLRFEPGAAYPNVLFRMPETQDFRGYGGLAFELTNPSETTVAFGARIDSVESSRTNSGARQGGGSVEPGQTVSFVLPFGVDASSLGMKALPGFGKFRSTNSGGTGVFDYGKVIEWQIFTVRPTEVKELIVDNFRLVPGQRQDFNGIVDAYGQYTRADWPGKVKSPADFAAQLKAEDADLAANPAPAIFNKYGGWAAGPQLKATGFFRTEKYKGKWSLVDPEGRLFISVGPDTIGASGTTKVTGREYMFSVLGKDDPVLDRYTDKEKGQLDFTGANLERKYGPNPKSAFYQRTYDRLRSWGFNTIGAFSSWDTLNNGKVPYTATVWPAAGHARIATGNDYWRTMDDPFDPKFAVDVANATRGMAARIKDDPFFLGYFVGNEESLGYYRGGLRSHYSLVLGAFKLKAEASPAKRAFLTQLSEKYGGDIARLNTAWGTSFANFEAMNDSFTLKDPITAPLKEDLSALLLAFARQYFRTVQSELKKQSPNHLYLGCRFAGYSPEFLQAAREYTDVMSFNIYRLKIDPKEFQILDDYDHPVLVGEFHFGATDTGMFDSGLVGVADQAARGRAYGDYIFSIADHPLFVGAHWFQYGDQPTTGRAQDGENGNVGFVSVTDTPYTDLIKAARQTHEQMYLRRYGKP